MPQIFGILNEASEILSRGSFLDRAATRFRVGITVRQSTNENDPLAFFTRNFRPVVGVRRIW